MKPVLEELARKYEGRVAVRLVDLREPAGKAEGEERRVTLIPTQILLDADGTERFRHEGFLPLEELEAAMEEAGWLR